MNIAENQIYTRYMYSYPHKTAYRKIEAIDMTAAGDVFTGMNNSLYIHIPFCKSKCGYCNLFSITGKNKDYFDKYIQALEKHSSQLSELNISFNSLIIGGGTPLILNSRYLERLFLMSNSLLNIDLQRTFICVETSPNDTTKLKTKILKENHVNRVSIGVQSFIDSELKILNRAHNVASIQTALNILAEADFPAINIDIIYGIPTQTTESLKHSLEQAVNYSPKEIFLYPLYTRKDSFITDGLHSDKYSLYLFARDYLLENGYIQISMRKFSKTKIQFNLGCGFENTISLGAGGRSYIGNIHTCLPYSNVKYKCIQIIDEYIESENKLLMDFGYILNEDEQKRRYIIKNLLIANGLGITEYAKAFNSDLFYDFQILHYFIEQNYCVIISDRLVLTPLGLSLSDYLGPMFISNDVKTKMKEWDFDDC